MGRNEPVQIDMRTYARREHFNYYRNMAYPYTGVTVNVDITRFSCEVKARGWPFFLSFLYCAAHAANAVPEFRRRIDGDGITEYAWCDTSHTVARPDGTYGYCRLQSDMPYREYLARAIPLQEAVKTGAGLDTDGDEPSLFFVSTVPWLSYTALIQPVPIPAHSHPQIVWGKYFAQDGALLMPVTTLCHHALVAHRALLRGA